MGALFGSVAPVNGTTETGIITVNPPLNGEDAVPIIREAVATAVAGSGHLKLAPGVYHLHRDYATERLLHVANHDDGLRRIAFPLNGVDRLHIEGNGAQLLCHDPLIPFLVSDSQDVTIENLSINWANPFFLQGVVVAVHEEADAFEIEVLPECQVTLVEGQLLFGPGLGSRREGWWQNIEWNYWIDSTTGAAAAVQPKLMLWNDRLDRPYRAEMVAPNRFRLVHASYQLPQVGSVLICKGTREANRTSPAIHLLRSRKITLRDVYIHHAGGTGLIAERCANITLQRVVVAPPPGSERLVSTTADATHFVYCRGRILVEDSRFESMLDDTINVHGVYAPVTKQLNAMSVGVTLFHHQQRGITFATPGEKLRFVDAETLLAYVERTVSAVRSINDGYLEIEFTEPIDGVLRPHTALENSDWQAELVFRRNLVRNNRARSILITTAGRVLIEDNRFERSSMINILMEGDCHFWHESGSASEVMIRRNTFVGLHPALPPIRISPKQPRNTRMQPPYHRGISIVENRFEAVHPLILYANRVANLTFSDNRIVAQDGISVEPGTAIHLRASEGVTIQGNAFELSAPPKVIIEPTNQRVAIEGNQGLAVK